MSFPFRRKYRKITYVLCVVLIIYALYQLSPEGISFEDSVKGKIGRKFTEERTCNAMKVRQEICHDYLSHKSGGNLCEDLCTNSKIYIEPLCSSRKETTIVLFGKWKNKDIVLKTKSGSHSYKDLDSELAYVYQSIDMSKDLNHFRWIFTNHIYEHILQDIFVEHLRKHTTPKGMLRRMYHPHSDTNISLADMRSLWLILQQEDYIKLQLLQDSKHFPRIYGFCGNYYAIERVKSLDNFNNILALPLPWPERVKIAIGLLDMVKEFKNTFIGRLSHCDVQPGNLGVARDGRVVALDVDTVFTASQMDMFMAQGNCSSSSECAFFDCISACINGKCTDLIVTNNLHVVCKDLFFSGWGQLGLLSMSSAKTQEVNRLQTYLKQCIDVTRLPWREHDESKLHSGMYNLLLQMRRSNR